VRALDLGAYKRSLRDSLIVGYKLLRGVLWADVSFSWFAEKHAEAAVKISRMLGKPSVVVVGGYEVACIPEVGYGSQLDPKKAKMVRYVLSRATKVLPVDGSLTESAVKQLSIDPANFEVLPTCYEPVGSDMTGPKERIALTVGLMDKVRIRVKGLDVFVKTASLLPDVRFIFVGGAVDSSVEALRGEAPPNVEFVGFLPRDQLAQYYRRAKVYCQLSMSEGLPNALCEAMLHECVPVGTKVGGVPTAMGETGFYVPVGDAQAAAEAVKKALESGTGQKARERIEGLFPKHKREKRLTEIIEELTR
jgi:glycosyltransferase involved in cell wall biosynthesis